MTQSELHDRLEKAGWWRPFAEFEAPEKMKHKPAKDSIVQHLAFKQGRRAFWKGAKRRENPYWKGMLLSELWDSGWLAARKKWDNELTLESQRRVKKRKSK